MLIGLITYKGLTPSGLYLITQCKSHLWNPFKTLCWDLGCLLKCRTLFLLYKTWHHYPLRVCNNVGWFGSWHKQAASRRCWWSDHQTTRSLHSYKIDALDCKTTKQPTLHSLLSLRNWIRFFWGSNFTTPSKCQILLYHSSEFRNYFLLSSNLLSTYTRRTEHYSVIFRCSPFPSYWAFCPFQRSSICCPFTYPPGTCFGRSSSIHRCEPKAQSDQTSLNR